MASGGNHDLDRWLATIEGLSAENKIAFKECGSKPHDFVELADSRRLGDVLNRSPMSMVTQDRVRRAVEMLRDKCRGRGDVAVKELASKDYDEITKAFLKEISLQDKFGVLTTRIGTMDLGWPRQGDAKNYEIFRWDVWKANEQDVDSTYTALLEWHTIFVDGWRVAPLNLSTLDGFLKLTRVELSKSGLQGPIPVGFGNLANLDILDLGGNELDGVIPTAIGRCSKLTVLKLGANKLCGKIPEEICDLQNLKILGLNYNKLEGQIPSGVGGLTKLKELYLGGNKLEGVIPDQIYNLTSLEVLKLQKQEGELLRSPASGFKNLTKFTSLKTLSLHGNANLVGTVPIATCTQLKSLKLRGSKVQKEGDESGSCVCF